MFANTGLVFASRLIAITVEFLLSVNINIIFSGLQHFPQHAGWSDLQIGPLQPLRVTVIFTNGRISASLIAGKWEKM